MKIKQAIGLSKKCYSPNNIAFLVEMEAIKLGNKECLNRFLNSIEPFRNKLGLVNYKYNDRLLTYKYKDIEYPMSEIALYYMDDDNNVYVSSCYYSLERKEYSINRNNIRYFDGNFKFLALL